MKLLIKFFICGIFTSLVFPPFFLIPIGFLIFPYTFNLLISNEHHNLSLTKIFFLGFLYGLGFFTIYLSWIKEPFLIDDLTKQYTIFSYLLIIYCSLYFGIIFLIINFFKGVIVKFITFPLLIVCSEFICSNFIYGFPWFSFSLVHSFNIFGTSLVYYFGTYGLSYLTIATFMFPAIFFLENNKLKKLIFNYYFILFILFILLISIRIIQSNLQNIDQKEVSLVQMNYPNNQSLSSKNLLDKNADILEIIRNNQSDIIIFGENDYPFLINDKEINVLQKNILDKQVIIIGSTRKENESYYNSFLVIDKLNYQIFDKKILVPFGEFIPLRSIFNFMEFIAGSVDYSVGQKKRIINLIDNTKIIPVICYEIIYFWKLINMDNKNSDVIVNLTNDSWFGTFSGPYQHFYFAKLRASEFNKPVIRVSNNGVSAIINRFGKIVDYIKLNEKNIKKIKIDIVQNNNNFLYLHKIVIFLFYFILFLSFIISKNYERKKI